MLLSHSINISYIIGKWFSISNSSILITLCWRSSAVLALRSILHPFSINNEPHIIFFKHLFLLMQEFAFFVIDFLDEFLNISLLLFIDHFSDSFSLLLCGLHLDFGVSSCVFSFIFSKWNFTLAKHFIVRVKIDNFSSLAQFALAII